MSLFTSNPLVDSWNPTKYNPKYEQIVSQEDTGSASAYTYRTLDSHVFMVMVYRSQQLCPCVQTMNKISNRYYIGEYLHKKLLARGLVIEYLTLCMYARFSD